MVLTSIKNAGGWKTAWLNVLEIGIFYTGMGGFIPGFWAGMLQFAEYNKHLSVDCMPFTPCFIVKYLKNVNTG
jgi:hypothetical protein